MSDSDSSDDADWGGVVDLLDECSVPESASDGLLFREAVADQDCQTQLFLTTLVHGAESLTTVGPSLISLSSLREASIRTMLELPDSSSHISGSISDSTGRVLSETGRVPMDGDDWIPLNASGSAIRMCTVECAGGWTICFDVKDCEDWSVLRSINLMRADRSHKDPCSSREADDAPSSSEAEGCQQKVVRFAPDCLDCDETSEMQDASDQARSRLVKAQQSANLGFPAGYRPPQQLPAAREPLELLADDGSLLASSGWMLDAALWR